MRTLIYCLFLQVSICSSAVAQWDTLPNRMFADTLHFPFLYGVASGDPTHQAVIIWTKIEPKLTDSIANVNWQIADDEEMTNIIQSGSSTTSANKDWTVKIEVNDLLPHQFYYYRFVDLEGRHSTTGRTKTALDQNTYVEKLNFAITSCSSIYSGYFNAYARIAERNDIDLWIHLGDYIYDFVDEDEQVRVSYPPPIDPQTKTEFWQRHRYYLLDPDLRAVRQQHPIAALWDNHDIYKNNEDDLIGSMEAFFEYLPIRQPDMNNTKRIYRTLQYGNLADIFFMDIEVLRNQDTIPGTNERSLLSNTQYNWLTNALEASTATWHIIGNQKLFSNWAVDHVTIPLPFGNGQVADPGAWDGYPAERDRLLTFLKEQDINNNIIISGDIHLSVASDLVINPKDSFEYNAETGEGAIGVEFVPGSVSRGNVDEVLSMELNQAFSDLLSNLSFSGNPHQKYLDLTQHGYGLLQITADSTAAQFIYSDKLEIVDTDTIFKELIVYTGENHWKTALPEIVGTNDFTNALSETVQISNLHPNPAKEVCHFNIQLEKTQLVAVHLLQMSGNTIHYIFTPYQKMLGAEKNHPFAINTAILPTGLYVVLIKGEDFIRYKKLITLN